MFPLTRQQVSIRIDTRASGESSGHVVRQVWDRDDGWYVAEDRWFAIQKSDATTLDDTIAESNVWHIYPEFWQIPQGGVCVDGVEITIEKTDPAGYRYSEANAQCSASASMLKLAGQIVRMARFSDNKVDSWLH